MMTQGAQGTRKQWFIYSKGKQEGPFTDEELRDKLARKEIAGSVHAWCEGMENWKHLQEIDTFKGLIAAAPPSTASIATPHMATPAVATPAVATPTVATPMTATASPAHPTIVSKSPTSEELSALIEVRPDTSEQTGAMDLATLQKGQAEAARATRMQKMSEKSEQLRVKSEKPEKSGWTKFVVIGILVFVLGGAANFFMAGRNGSGGPLGAFFDRFFSSLPKLDDVSKDDYAAMKRAAAADLAKSGAQIALAKSMANPAAPKFYVGTNLPEGTKFNVILKPLASSIVGKVPPILSVSAIVNNKHLAESGTVKMRDGSGVPLGQYQAYLTDADGEPAAASAALSSYPVVRVKAEGAVSGGRKLLASDTVYVGGNGDDDYKVQLRVYHERMAKDAQEAVKGFEDISSAIDSQLISLEQSAALIAKSPNRRGASSRDKLWADFSAKWGADEAKVDDSLKKLADYKVLSAAAQGAVAALLELGKAEQEFLRTAKRGADLTAATQAQRDKLTQATKDFKAKIDEATQQAKAPWADAPLLEKEGQ